MQRVGDVAVGVEGVGVLDQQRDPLRLRRRLAGLDQRGEAVGGRLPVERAARAGEHVDRPRAQCRGQVDRPEQARRGLAAVALQPGARGERVVEARDLQIPRFQRRLQLAGAVEQRRRQRDAAHADRAAVVEEQGGRLAGEGDLVERDTRMHRHALPYRFSISTPKRSRNGRNSSLSAAMS